MFLKNLKIMKLLLNFLNICKVCYSKKYLFICLQYYVIDRILHRRKYSHHVEILLKKENDFTLLEYKSNINCIQYYF